MASILPDYEYDIFISYRQKDNRSDQWVTHFVKALKEELDSSFKKEISVYFDENPHDGLNETHDVDASLKDKVRCLVFIPIVSRTYCDPSSFAWSNEFLPFLNFASGDKNGLKVRLANGNVASRILPVRIHDLDTEDIALFEKKTGGVMRGVDFVYSEPGVNRPLLPNEENPGNNLNNTMYRNQVNKVSNAVREILNNIGKQNHPSSSQNLSASDSVKPTGLKKPEIKRKKTVWLVSVSVLALAIVFFWYLSKTGSNTKHESQQNPTITLGILPFTNLSKSSDQDYFADVMTQGLSTSLAQSDRITIIGQVTMQNYADKQTPIETIGKELNLTHLITAGVQRMDNDVRVNIQLINPANGVQEWGRLFDKTYTKLFDLQDELAREIAGELLQNLLPEDIGGREMTTKNLDAYDLFQQARFVSEELFYGEDLSIKSYLKTVGLLQEAIALDKNFAEAHALLAFNHKVAQALVFEETTKLDSLSKLALQEIDVALQLAPENHYVAAMSSYANLHINPDMSIREGFRAITHSPKNSFYWYITGLALCFNTGLYDDTYEMLEYALKTDPDNQFIYYLMTRILIVQQDFEKAIVFNEEVLKRYPESTMNQMAGALIYTQKGEAEKANEKIESFREKNSMRNLTQWVFSQYYALIGDSISAFKYIDDRNDLNIRAKLGNKKKLLESIKIRSSNEDDIIFYSDYLWLKNSHFFNFVRDEPLFKQLLEKEKEKYDLARARYAPEIRKLIEGDTE